MRKTEPTVFMNMCMICSDGKVLVQERKKQDWPGIAFPSGHVEEGESFTEAVIREIWEETGLTISAPRLCGIKDWVEEQVRYVVLLYMADRFEGTLRASEEGEVWWADMETVFDRPFAAEDMRDTLRVFLENDLSEFFYRKDGDAWLRELK